jgi:hypothetical protein
MEIKHIGICLEWLLKHLRDLPGHKDPEQDDFDYHALYKAREEFHTINQKVLQPELTHLELQSKIHDQKRQLAMLNECLATKNRELDAMHFVWCDGGCGGGVHRYEEMAKVPLTEDVVKRAEANVRRLRTWFVNNNRVNKTIGGQVYVTFPKRASRYWKFLMWLAKFDRGNGRGVKYKIG